MAAIKSFSQYVGLHVPEYLEEARKISSLSLKKVPHKMVDYLEPDEVRALFDSVDLKSANGFRDKAILLLMYNTGARVQEIIDITLDDLRLDSVAHVQLVGKGKKERACPLWAETAQALHAYLDVRRSTVAGELRVFLNGRGFPITRFGIRYIIQKYASKAITSKSYQKMVSPHTMRHTTAMHLLQSGNELNMIRLWLGHASLNTTHMYVEIDAKMKKEILEKCQPPVLKEQTKSWKKPGILKWLDSLMENTDDVMLSSRSQTKPF